MTRNSYTTTFTVEQSPEQVFAAINNVRAWWSGEIDGPTDKLGAQFTFRYKDVHHKDVHRSTQTIIELVPGRKVAWRVNESEINFVDDKEEWNGTELVFDISRKGGKTELRFTHIGLVPEIECYDGCSGAWGFYVNESLRRLITTGEGQPNIAA
jgi:hypothetical protein